MLPQLDGRVPDQSARTISRPVSLEARTAAAHLMCISRGVSVHAQALRAHLSIYCRKSSMIVSLSFLPMLRAGCLGRVHVH